MRVTLLVDNLADSGLRSEHGLSFLVETDGGSVLFDTGQSDAWMDNLARVGGKASDVAAVAVSHGHYDHTGGLARAMRAAQHARFFAHPACFRPKYAKSAGAARCVGMPADAVKRKAAFTLNRSPVEMVPGVILSGEIGLREGMTTLDARFVTGNDGFRQDTFEDEQCMIVRSGDWTAVLVGCAHRGAENNVLSAMAVAGVARIDLLAGGFHLSQAGKKRLRSLAGFLEDVEIGQIACCHCTGIGAYEYLRSKLGSQVVLARAGVSWQV